MKNIIYALICCFILILSGCSPKMTPYPVEVKKIEWRDKYIRDSIFEKEYINTYQKGDTVFKDRYVYVYKDKIKNDSVYICDTIRVPYPVKGDPVEVNRLKWYQEACIWFTSLVLVALALYLGIKYRGSIISFFRKMIFKV